MRLSNYDSFIDPSDVEIEADEFTAAIEEKKDEIAGAKVEVKGAIIEADSELIAETSNNLTKLQDELVAIEAEAMNIIELHEECENYAYGSTLINESQFQEHCKELAYDCGDVQRDGIMSAYIDWERFAEDCKVDYTTITFRGTDFYVQG